MSVLGMLEVSSIAVGIRSADAMVKAAPVELLESRPITPGKYMTLVTGEVAAVEASVLAGFDSAGAEKVVERFVIANLHTQILPLLRGGPVTSELEAVGVIETISAAKIVEAADAACKAAPVRLITLHLANHIGGKGYTVFTGPVADVEASADAAARAAGAHLLEQVVIPNLYPEMYDFILRSHGW
jgi:microcompartment protein CcmL/EutN